MRSTFDQLSGRLVTASGMKRKKWTEQEELTLLTKYADLSSTGALSKLKTREKKFRPIADHVSAVHHLVDPVRFPFRWTWRDVSVKVQNMRNQYVGVKHKIRSPNGLFDWPDGDNHWENFLKYREVFGDVELLDSKDKDRASGGGGVPGFDDGDRDNDGDDYDEGLEEGGAEVEVEDGEEDDGLDAVEKRRELMKGRKRKRARLGEFGKRVLGLREAIVRREEERSEREFRRDKVLFERKRKEAEFRWELETEREIERKNLKEFEEREEAERARRESDRWTRFAEGFVEEEQRRRMRMEERREEEEMEWRERMVCLQMEHEKAMMQMHADACQNQLQILGVMARMVCQLFGSIGGNIDGLGGGGSGGIGGLHLHPHQVLQNLHHHHHPSGLDDGVKPDGGNSPSEFL